ncbi:MAG: sialidase family protein [bacterium]
MKEVLFLYFFGSIISFAQPMNGLNVSVISDSSIFPHGTFEACHASTIVETTPGNFLAAWFAGSHEGANDVVIWISYFRENTWSHPIEIAKGIDSLGQNFPCWNPVLFKTSTDKLILFYKVGKNPREWWGCYIQSSDYGESWSAPENLPEGFFGPIKNKPIQLKNGNILCPSSIETTGGKWSVHLEITDEALTSWRKIEIEKDSAVGVIQPTILSHHDGKLQMLCRSRQNVIYQSWSTDNGESWTKLSETTVPNPNSGIDAVTLNDGSFVLVYNPLQKGEDWFNGRNVLNVALSKDGVNWKDIYQLENEKDGEFSYPAVIQASDGSIHITYTVNRRNIEHVVIKIKGEL